MSPRAIGWSDQDVNPSRPPETRCARGENCRKRARAGCGSSWSSSALAAAGSGGCVPRWPPGRGQDAKHAERTHAGAGFESAPGEPRVQVVKPERGGMERTTNQPGTVRAFEYAELFAKVSGFVKTLNVDRGSRVKKGELLAEIYDPERDVAVEQAEAALEHAKAAVAQAESSISSAQASVLAAKAEQNEAKAVLEQKMSERDYRKKQYIRIDELVKKGRRRGAPGRRRARQLSLGRGSGSFRGGRNRDRRRQDRRGDRQGRAGQGRLEGRRRPASR